MTHNADRYRYLHRLVPLDLAGDRTHRDADAPAEVDDPRLVTPLNPHGTRAVRRLLERIAGGAVEAELVEAERERRRTAQTNLEVRRERLNAFRRQARAVAAETRAPIHAPTVRRVCDCGCGEVFDAREGQRFVDMKHKQRVKNRKWRAARRGLAFGGAA